MAEKSDDLKKIRQVAWDEAVAERKLLQELYDVTDRMYHLGRAHAYEIILDEIDSQ